MCAGIVPGTLQIALTESERGSIVTPRPFDCIQLGGESLPYTRSHLSLLYWRLGLCQADKFECLALGNKLSAYIDGLRTEYVHRSHSVARLAQHAFVALAASRSLLAVRRRRRKEADPRMLALIGTSGSGKTRSLLELLCLRFGLLLVADTRGNGGASDFARVVRCGRLSGARHENFGRQVAACVLARLLVLQHARANDWTPTQFLNIQLFDSGLFRDIQLRLEATSLADLDRAIQQLLKVLNIKGLPIVIDEAQVLLPDKPSRNSLFKVATVTMAEYTTACVAPVVLIVSGTSIALKDVESPLASGLLKRDQSLLTMTPSPLTADDVTSVVRQALGSEPPAAVGELLHGRGRFVMTFLSEVLSVEIADSACGVAPRARARPAASGARPPKRARTAAANSAAGAPVAAGAGAGAAAARDVAVAGYVGEIGDGVVPVANVDPQKWDTAVWLEHLANAEHLMLFGGRSTVEHLTRAVSRFCDENFTPFSYCRRGVTALGKAAVSAALGAEKCFKPRDPSEASRLLQTGLAWVCSFNGAPQVVVYEPLVWRAILVAVLEQLTFRPSDVLCGTMLNSFVSANALGFIYELVQPSRWATMFHGHWVNEVPLFNTWRPPCLPGGRSLGQVYNGRMEVVAVDDVFERTGYARPFRGSSLSGCGEVALVLIRRRGMLGFRFTTF